MRRKKLFDGVGVNEGSRRPTACIYLFQRCLMVFCQNKAATADDAREHRNKTKIYDIVNFLQN